MTDQNTSHAFSNGWLFSAGTLPAGAVEGGSRMTDQKTRIYALEWTVTTCWNTGRRQARRFTGDGDTWSRESGTGERSDDRSVFLSTRFANGWSFSAGSLPAGAVEGGSWMTDQGTRDLISGWTVTTCWNTGKKRGRYHGIKRVVLVDRNQSCLEPGDHAVQAVRELVHALDLLNLARELLVKNGTELLSISAVVVDAAGRLVVVSSDTRAGFPRTRGGE